MPSERDQAFVESMLKSAKEKKDVKPQSVSEGIDPTEIDQIVGNIRDRIQKKR
jgi:hypothetical protein